MISRSSSKLGHVGSNTRSLGPVSSGNFVRMLILIIYRSSAKLGHVRSKTRSLGQILKKKPCVHSRVHSFVSNVMKLCQNVDRHYI